MKPVSLEVVMNPTIRVWKHNPCPFGKVIFLSSLTYACSQEGLKRYSIKPNPSIQHKGGHLECISCVLMIYEGWYQRVSYGLTLSFHAVERLPYQICLPTYQSIHGRSKHPSKPILTSVVTLRKSFSVGVDFQVPSDDINYIGTLNAPICKHPWCIVTLQLQIKSNKTFHGSISDI